MQVKESNKEGLKRGYQVVVPAADIEEKINSRLSELASTARMPGFRPGKVPASLLRKTHGQAIMGEVIEATVNESAQKTINDQDLRPVAKPKIEIEKFEEGSDLEYSLNLEIFPEIKLADFSKLKLERLKVPPDDGQLNQMIEQMASGQKDSKPVEQERAVGSGDIVVINFTGSVDGNEFAGGKADGYSLEIGSGSFIPGFEDQVIGKKVDEEFDVNVTFPKEYAKELAGKDAVFKVKITELREAIPVEINDDFAKKMGAENLPDLKAKLSENQEAEMGQYSRMRVKRDLLDKLDELHEFDLPENMIEGEFESVWNQFEQQRKEHPEQLEQEDKDKSDEELKEEYREISARRVRLALLLAEIAEVNNISVSSEEVNGAVMREAQRHKGKEKEVFDYYKNNPEAIQSLQSPLLEDKVVDFIIELADVEDKEVTVEELMAMPEPVKPARKKKAKKSSSTAATSEKKSSTKKKTVTAKKAGSKKKPTNKPSAGGKK